MALSCFAGLARWWRRGLLVVGLLSVLSGTGHAQSPSPDCAVLERLAGTWLGRGNLQRHALSGKEPVRCRVDNAWSGARREVGSRLDCRGVDGDLTFEGAIAATGDDGFVDGTLEGSAGLEQGVLSGWCEADAVKLDLTGLNTTTREPIEARLAISLSESDSTLTNAMEARDPDTGDWFSVLEVSFER